MKTTFIVLFSFSTFLSQEHPDTYLFTHQINENLDRDTTSAKYEVAAWNYSFVGDYQKALWAYDQVTRGYPELTPEQELYFLSYKPINAREYILARAEKERIIMFNEAHHQPMHRTFTTSLLQDLYDRGYRYLGLEALAYDDQLNDRGYPVSSTGYYIKEPQFGNLVREALSIGYELFSYETQTNVNGKEREIQQARNIRKTIDAHPGEKFLIHCGFGHINEAGEVRGWEKAMAGRVKEYTGIDPFTINQVILTEHFFSEKENPFFKLVDTLKQSSVFVRENGSVFQGLEGDKRFDVRLFHPRTTYENGRPSWLLINGRRSFYFIDQNEITIDYPVLIKAFHSEEPEDAVPVDVIEIANNSDQKALILPKGNYRLEMKNTKGETISKNVVVD